MCVRIWPYAAAASRGDEAARAAFDARLQEIMAGECAGACAGAARDFHLLHLNKSCSTCAVEPGLYMRFALGASVYLDGPVAA